MPAFENIAIIGSGKLATALGYYLIQKRLPLNGIWSRQERHKQALANTLHVSAVETFDQLKKYDLIIIAISDQAIEIVAEKISQVIPNDQPTVVHTSGATGLDVLSKHLKNTGIFYPLQTFSEGFQPDFSKIPICIESNSKDILQKLEKLGQEMGNPVYHLDSDKRATLHVGAVLVNNFTNHLFGLATELLEQDNLPPDLLRPLLEETARKLQTKPATEVQTGPAVRNDQVTLEKHRKLLADQPNLLALYDLLTKSILSKTE